MKESVKNLIRLAREVGWAQYAESANGSRLSKQREQAEEKLREAIQAYNMTENDPS